MNISSLEHFKEKYKVRHNPKKKQDIIVNIHDEKIMAEETEEIETKEEEPSDKKEAKRKKSEDTDEDGGEESEKPEKKRKPTVVDKSATANIDRELVLKRIREFKKPKKTDEMSFFYRDEAIEAVEAVEPVKKPTAQKTVKIMSPIKGRTCSRETRTQKNTGETRPAHQNCLQTPHQRATH
jgi:hypothetical protein